MVPGLLAKIPDIHLGRAGIDVFWIMAAALEDALTIGIVRQRRGSRSFVRHPRKGLLLPHTLGCAGSRNVIPDLFMVTIAPYRDKSNIVAAIKNKLVRWIGGEIGALFPCGAGPFPGLAGCRRSRAKINENGASTIGVKGPPRTAADIGRRWPG